MLQYPLIKRKHSSPFADPVITAYSEEEEEEEEEDSIISSSLASSPSFMHQKLSPPQPTASTSLDHLWSKQEKYDNLELRLLSLEDSEKHFEYRLQMLERRDKNNTTLQPMKPDQQQEKQQEDKGTMHQYHDSFDAHDKDDGGANNYKRLYHSLLDKYAALEIRLKEKDKEIQELTAKKQLQPQPQQQQQQQQQQAKKQEEDKPYREEGGYLVFDTTSMNGDITHCRVKIPSYQKQEFFASPPSTTVGSPQHRSPLPSSHHHHNHHHHSYHSASPKRGLNPNAPEWKKKPFY